jgi:hypothetical protein
LTGIAADGRLHERHLISLEKTSRAAASRSSPTDFW